MLFLFGCRAVLRETCRGSLAVRRRLATTLSAVAIHRQRLCALSSFPIAAPLSSPFGNPASSRSVEFFNAIPVRFNHTGSKPGAVHPSSDPDPSLLPSTCPGCGSFSQWLDTDKPGYYTTSRRSVKKYLEHCAFDSKKVTDTSAAELAVNSDDLSPSPSPPPVVDESDSAASKDIEPKDNGRDLSSTSPGMCLRVALRITSVCLSHLTWAQIQLRRHQFLPQYATGAMI